MKRHLLALVIVLLLTLAATYLWAREWFPALFHGDTP